MGKDQTLENLNPKGHFLQHYGHLNTHKKENRHVCFKVERKTTQKTKGLMGSSHHIQRAELPLPPKPSRQLRLLPPPHKLWPIPHFPHLHLLWSPLSTEVVRELAPGLKMHN